MRFNHYHRLRAALLPKMRATTWVIRNSLLTGFRLRYIKSRLRLNHSFLRRIACSYRLHIVVFRLMNISLGSLRLQFFIEALG